MDIQFQYKEMAWGFLAAGLLVLLYGYRIRWARLAARRMGDAVLVSRLISYYSPRRAAIKLGLVLLALCLGVIALMNPRLPGSGSSVNRKGIDIAIALDVSKSMLAADMPPSRLERAKQFIYRLMESMPDDRFALVLFAGKAYMQMPLTADHGAAGLFVSAAGPDAVPQQGTVISQALEMSAAVFNSSERRFKTVLLISDGEDHDPGAASKAAELAGQGIMVNTIGIGSPGGATLTDPATGELKKDATGQPVVSKLNEDELKEIAARTNGMYIHLESSDAALGLLKQQLAQIDRKAYGDPAFMSYTYYYPWLALVLLLLLFMESLLSDNRGKNKTKAA